jgi:excisionase family DNA binding protein
MRGSSGVPVVLGVKDVAKVLGICTEKVCRLLKSGELTGFRLGVNWRIREQDLQKFIEVAIAKEARRRG